VTGTDPSGGPAPGAVPGALSRAIAPPVGPPPLPPGFGGITPAAGRPRLRRRRRWSLLAGALVVLSGSVALAVALSHPDRSSRTAAPSAVTVAPDQQLAQGLLLTQSDLPAGWQPGTGGGPAGQSAHNAQLGIELTFTQCMGIGQSQASMLLGGQATDQTAQAVSPVFVGPTAPGGQAGSPAAGTVLELQTVAAVVRTQADARGDLALFGLPRYPSCLAALSAAELQLGIDQASGGTALPGIATGAVVPLSAPAGTTVLGIAMSFIVTDAGSTVPVVMDQVVVGHDRVEAQLQAFAIGSPFPSDILASSIARFESLIIAPGGPTAV